MKVFKIKDILMKKFILALVLVGLGYLSVATAANAEERGGSSRGGVLRDSHLLDDIDWFFDPSLKGPLSPERGEPTAGGIERSNSWLLAGAGTAREDLESLVESEGFEGAFGGVAWGMTSQESRMFCDFLRDEETGEGREFSRGRGGEDVTSASSEILDGISPFSYLSSDAGLHPEEGPWLATLVPMGTEGGQTATRKRRASHSLADVREKRKAYESNTARARHAAQKNNLTRLKEWARTDPLLQAQLDKITAHQRPEQRALRDHQEALQKEMEAAKAERETALMKLFKAEGRRAEKEKVASVQKKIEELSKQIANDESSLVLIDHSLRMALYEEEAARRTGRKAREEAAFHVSPVPQGEPVGMLRAAAGREDVPMEEDSAAPAATSLEKAFNAAFARSQGAAQPTEEDSAAGGEEDRPARQLTPEEGQEKKKADARQYAVLARMVNKAKRDQLKEWAPTDPDLQQKMQAIEDEAVPEQRAVRMGQARVKSEREEAIKGWLELKKSRGDSEKTRLLEKQIKALGKKIEQEACRIAHLRDGLYIALYKEEAVKRGGGSLREEAAFQASPVPQQKEPVGTQGAAAAVTAESRGEASAEPTPGSKKIKIRKPLTPEARARRKENHRAFSAKQRDTQKRQLDQLKEWAQNDSTLQAQLDEITAHQRPEQRALKEQEVAWKGEKQNVIDEWHAARKGPVRQEEWDAFQKKVEHWKKQITQVMDRERNVARKLLKNLYTEEAAKRQVHVADDALPALETAGSVEQADEGEGLGEAMAVEEPTLLAAPSVPASLEDGQEGFSEAFQKRWARRCLPPQQGRQKKKVRAMVAAREKRARKKDHLEELREWAERDPLLYQEMQAIKDETLPEQRVIRAEREQLKEELKKERETLRQKKASRQNAEEVLRLQQRIEDLVKKIESQRGRLTREGNRLYGALYRKISQEAEEDEGMEGEEE